MENTDAFPVRKITVKLKKTNPTRLTPEDLQKQMYGIGLKCKDTSIENLAKYKAEVLQDLFTTGLQTCEISKPSNDFSEIAFLNGKLGDSDEPYIDGAMNLVKAADGEWTWDDTAAGYQKELSAIQVPANFDYLMENRVSFAGRVKKVERKEQLKSVDAIKSLYVETASAASTTLSGHINKDSVEAFFSNVISPLGPGDISKDYNCSSSRVLFLTLNHVGDQCDGIGVINASYDIHIKNYTRKEKNGGDYHDTSITVMCRGAFYSSLELLLGDYEALKTAFKDARCLMTYPKEPVPVTVFDALPPAGQEAFVQGIPSALTDTYSDSIILHSPYVENLKSVNSAGSQGFFLKNVILPTSGINYVIKAPASDALGAASTTPIRMINAHQRAMVKTYENPVDLCRTVYKADILRHSLKDGSYEYIESGEYYGDCTEVAGEIETACVRCPAASNKEDQWCWDNSGTGFKTELTAITAPGNFDYLIVNCPNFQGRKAGTSSREQLSSMEAFGEFFVRVSEKAFSNFNPIYKESLEAFLGYVADGFKGEGHFSRNQVLLLPLNHQDDTCDGVGAVNCGFDVDIKDSGRGHFDVAVSVELRGVFYTNIEDLFRDYDFIKHN